MLRDHDADEYVVTGKIHPKYPKTTVCLTFLILQAKADPNILPPKQHPTTMIGLAVELGNQNLVELLLEAAAAVSPEASTVPPLMVAVLHQHRGNVQALLGAFADPWQSVPISVLSGHPWFGFGMLSRQESVCAVQVAAAQDPTGICMNLLRD